MTPGRRSPAGSQAAHTIPPSLRLESRYSSPSTSHYAISWSIPLRLIGVKVLKSRSGAVL